jgi:hypothetical protein
MTPCTGTPAEQYLERYIQGDLPEFEAQRFEEHYFGCSVCLAQLEALQTVALKLGSQPRAAAVRVISWPIRAAAFGAIAALLVLGFIGVRAIRRPAPPAIAITKPAVAPNGSRPSSQQPLVSAAISHLADLSLPAFEAPHLRGQDGDANFDAGMKAYSAHDCGRAVELLSRVETQSDDAVAAKFYTGVCEMDEGKLAAASASLGKVAGARDSAQQEAAIYYLAQIALAREDATTARHYLARTIALHGDFEQRARAELKRIG